MEQRRSTDSMMESRVSSLEAHHERLHEDVASLNRAVSGVAEEMRQGFRRITEDKKTNWGAFASWAGVVLMVIGIGSSGYVRDLTRVENVQTTLFKDYIDHKELPGHPTALVMHKHMDDRLTHLDEILQREMRLLDDNINTSAVELDKRLQNEMRMLNDAQDREIVGLEKRLSKTEKWIVGHDRSVSGLNAEQSTRIEQLEREVYKKNKKTS